MGLAYSAVLPGANTYPPFPRTSALRSCSRGLDQKSRREEALLLTPSTPPGPNYVEHQQDEAVSATRAGQSLLAYAAAVAAQHHIYSVPSSPPRSRHRCRYNSDAVLLSQPDVSIPRDVSIELCRKAPAALPLHYLSGLTCIRFAADSLPHSVHTAEALPRFASTLTSLAFVTCLELSDPQLMYVSSLRRLRSLTLDGCVNITDEGLEALRGLSCTLKRLSLHGCKQLCRIGILSGLTSLEALSLEQCVQIEDEELAKALAGLTSLKVLGVAHCFRITSDAFLNGWLPGQQQTSKRLSCSRCRGKRRVAHTGVGLMRSSASYCSSEQPDRALRGNSPSVSSNMPSLSNTSICAAAASVTSCTSANSASLTDCHCDCTAAAARNALQRFLSLDVRCTQVDNKFWSVLGCMTSLRMLLLGGTSITDTVEKSQGRHGSDVLTQLTELRQLGLDRTVISDVTLQAIHKLPHLETLNLAYSQVTDIAMARYLSKMSSLLWLNVEETSITDYSLERLTGLVELRHLDLGDTAVSSFGVSALSFLTQLRSLNLSFTDISDKSLKALQSLHCLEVLSLDGEQRISDEGLAFLGSLDKLRELELYSARITDAGLLDFCHTSAAASLVSLDISCCINIFDISLKHGIVRMKCLEDLNLSQTSVTDDGVIAVIESLSELKTLNVSHTDVTDATVVAAREHGTLRRVSVHGCRLKAPPQPFASVAPAAAHTAELRLVA